MSREANVTVMLDRFFGVHPAVIRAGFWARMKPGEKDLYIYLLEESERHCTRELKRTDLEIRTAVGTSTRTLCDARKALSDSGLIQFLRVAGGKFVYTVCDPATLAPYPGDPRKRMFYSKQAGEDSTPPSEQPEPVEDAPAAPQAAAPQVEVIHEVKVCEVHGNLNTWYGGADGAAHCGICDPSPYAPPETRRTTGMTKHGLRGLFQ